MPAQGDRGTARRASPPSPTACSPCPTCCPCCGWSACRSSSGRSWPSTTSSPSSPSCCPASATTSTARSRAGSGWSRDSGQLLDPFADRLYIATTLLGLAWRDIIPWWLVVAAGRSRGAARRGAVVDPALRPDRPAGALRRQGRHLQPALRLPAAAPRRGHQHLRRVGAADRLGASRGGAPSSTGSPGSCTSCRPGRWWPHTRCRRNDHRTHVAPRRDAARHHTRTTPGRVDDAAHLDDGATPRPRVCRRGGRARSRRAARRAPAPGPRPWSSPRS